MRAEHRKLGHRAAALAVGAARGLFGRGESGATVSAEQLLERVWDEHADPFTNVVRMTIMTLRRKLGEPTVVETVIGVGYRMA